MQDFIFLGSLEEAQKQGLKIIDIRRPEEWEKRKLVQANQEIEMSELIANPHQFLQLDDKILLVCKAGARAIQAAEYLQALGFKNIFAFPSEW